MNDIRAKQRNAIMNWLGWKVCEYYSRDAEVLKSEFKNKPYPEMRQIVWTIMYRFFRIKDIPVFTLKEIGEYKGFKRDHATVMHGIKTVDNLCETNKEFNQRYHEIAEEFKTQFVSVPQGILNDDIKLNKEIVCTVLLGRNHSNVNKSLKR